MKVIILAAGEGRRLRPLTDTIPKCLVEYRGRPIIDYQLDAIRACGINEIVAIIGYKADVFHRGGVSTILNTDYANTNMVYTLFCAEKELIGNVIISYGDIIYGENTLKSLINCPDDFSTAIDVNWRQLWNKRMANPLTDAETLKVDNNGYITELGKKPKSYEEIQGQYMGLIMIRSTILNKIINLYHNLDKKKYYDGKDFNNMYMTSFLQLCLENVAPLKAVNINYKWIEIDRVEDLLVEI